MMTDALEPRTRPDNNKVNEDEQVLIQGILAGGE